MPAPDDIQKLPPVALVRLINAFRTLLLRMNRRLFPGTAVLYEQLQYFWLLPSLYVAARLDIAEKLREKPLTALEIARQVEADPVNMERLMRALTGGGIFRKNRDGRYALNSLARALVNNRGSLRHTIMHHLGPVNWNLMSDLEYSVKTGKDAFSARYGTDIYNYLRKHPEEYTLFDRSMSDLSELGLAPLLKAFNYGKFKCIVDVGGGEGQFLANILRTYPESRGILFDTPESVSTAPALFSRYGTGNRVTIVSGDFFRSVPDGGDLYILKNIIHNWNDDQSVVLLTRVAEAMMPGAKILILEMVVPEGNEWSAAKLLDIQMMASMSGGKERTASEYRTLLEKAGFSFLGIIPTIAPVCLVLGAGKR
ncbi:MAG TPA: methyltransferase [Bacteroidales bacterium]|nr:methyltransferase [Bacteroidales bacterium]